MNIKSLVLASIAISLTLNSCIEVEENYNQSDSGTGNTGGIVELKGTIANGEVRTLQSSNSYLLTGPLEVESGGKLVIPAGTTIKAVAGTTNTFIAVKAGGQIDAQGTSTNPIILTSNSSTPKRGDWGGLLILGNAPTNAGAGAQAEVTGLTYGGSNSADNSGIIKYVRIEYSGEKINSEKEFNGLSMYGVGSGTTIEYVQVHKGNDDGFEWFGGTVNTKYLVSSGNDDDMFDWTEGWKGTNEFWYGRHDADTGNRGIEADNNTTTPSLTPTSNPTIKNITLIGRGDAGSEAEGIRTRVGSYVQLDNVIFSNFKTGIVANGAESINAYTSGATKVTNVLFTTVGFTAQFNPTSLSTLVTLSTTTTGAGKGLATPDWALGWTTGL